MTRPPNVRRGQRGQALVMVTLSVGVVMGMLGLAVDVGWMQYVQQTAQSAADAGVMAAVASAQKAGTYTCASSGCAASYTDCSSVSSGTSLYSACQYASSNGFSSGGLGGKQTVQVESGVNSTPPGTAFTAKYWILMKVTQTVPQGFSAVLGNRTGTVAAASTAVVKSSGSASACVNVLDPTSQQALFITGQGTLNAQCGIAVMSTAATTGSTAATLVNGNSNLIGGPITLCGGYSAQGQSTVTGSPLYQNQGPSCFTNPFASQALPSAVTNKQNCDHTGQWYADQNSNNNSTINPGVYCGGIYLNGATVTFNPGTYILNGGGLTIQNSSNATGTGVTFLSTAYTTTNGSYTGSYRGFLLSDSIVRVNFSAPTSGSLDGLLFYQDPAAVTTPNSSGTASQIQARANTTLQGSIYLPTTSLTYTGEAATNEVVGLTVYDLTLNGSSSVTIATDTSGNLTGLGSSSIVVGMVQ